MKSTAPSEAQRCYPTRFSWPMRLFLFVFLGDMFVRSILLLLPYSSWNRELHVPTFPKSLPAAAELHEIAAAGGEPASRAMWNRYWQSLRSVGPYFSPVPSAETREKLDSPVNIFKYVTAWTASRMNFVGILLGVDQAWPMFSPDVGDDETLARLRLVFADGSTRTWHTCADPPDTTSYSHWFQEKHINTASKLVSDEDGQRGYCNWLVHQIPTNEAGSPLVRIEIYKIHYSYPSPSDDAFQFMAAQNVTSFGPDDKPIWVYDVASGTGRSTQPE